MIFTELLDACVDRLAGAGGDAYFTDPDKPVQVFAENRMDLVNELDLQLAKLGLGVVVAITRIADAGSTQGLAGLTVAFFVHEIPAINRVSGTQKSALDVAAKIISMIKEWAPEGEWHPFEFSLYELTDVDEDFGRVTWKVEMTTGTFLETIAEVISNESGEALGNEEGQELMVSPTAP